MNMVAHSFGGLVAFDVIKLMYKAGRQVRICLSDASPDALKIFGHHAFGDVWADNFDSQFLCRLLRSMDVKNIQMVPSRVISIKSRLAYKIYKYPLVFRHNRQFVSVRRQSRNIVSNFTRILCFRLERCESVLDRYVSRGTFDAILRRGFPEA